MENLKPSAQNCLLLSLLRGPNYSKLAEKILLFRKNGHTREVVAYDRWSHRQARLWPIIASPPSPLKIL